MRIIIIGGTGHVGTYLVPRLVALGHEIICVSRGKRQPYKPHGAWEFVQHVEADRAAEEAAGSFGRRIAELGGEVVIDMICYTPESSLQLAQALAGKVRQLLVCSTIWVYGHSEAVPTGEDQPCRPIDDYGRRKRAIEQQLLGMAQRGGFPVALLRPGHIVGEGWLPVNPAGHLDAAVFAHLAQGKEVVLPNLGLETVHHVHADDVAAAFVGAMNRWSAAVGEAFNITSPQALTLRGYAEAVAGWFGKEAKLRFLPLEEWRKETDPKQADITESHIRHSPCASIAKAQALIGYQPRYSTLQAVYESIEWAKEHGMMSI